MTPDEVREAQRDIAVHGARAGDFVRLAQCPVEAVGERRVEQHLHQLCGIGVDLLGKVGQRGTTTQAHRLAITLADTHTANQRRLDLVELLPALLARLATATGIAASEGALRTTTTTAATLKARSRSSWLDAGRRMRP